VTIADIIAENTAAAERARLQELARLKRKAALRGLRASREWAR
jgi:hypothetical protein